MFHKKDGRILRIFISSDGEGLLSVLNALRYLVKNNYSKEDIDLLVTCMIQDGWERHELLPKGWYRKTEGKHKKGSFQVPF